MPVQEQEASEDEMMGALFDELKASVKDCFPKRCECCGQTYQTIEEYLEETEGLEKGRGWSELFDFEDKSVVDIFRNCSCGSTLVAVINERRDHSEKGNRRREVFGKLLDILVKTGFEHKTAKEELLKVVYGQKSKLILNHLAGERGKPFREMLQEVRAN